MGSVSKNGTLPETIQTIPEELTFWAERTPDAPAIVWEEGSLGYGELATKAAALTPGSTGRGLAVIGA